MTCRGELGAKRLRGLVAVEVHPRVLGEEAAYVAPRPRRPELERARADRDARAAGERARRARDERLDGARALGPAPTGAVPLEHRELGVVVRAALAATEDLAERVQAIDATSDEPLALVLGARDEVALLGGGVLDDERVEVHLETGRRYGDGRLDLEEATVGEEAADRVVELGARP